MVSTLLLVMTVTSTLVTAAVAAWVFKRRHRMPAATLFVALLAVQGVWVGGHIGEVLAQTLDGKMLWDSLQNLAFSGLPPAYLLLGARFSGARFPRAVTAVVAAAAGVCGLVLATEPWHHQARWDARLVGSPPVLTYSLGVWDLILAVLALGAVMVASAMVMRRATREHRLYAVQSTTVAIAFAIPPLVVLLGLGMNLSIDGDRDITPVAFTLGAVVAAWGLGRQRLFDLAPIARDTVMATLPDPVLVLDGQGLVVDANPAALAFLAATDREVTGQPAAAVLARVPALAKLVVDGRGQLELCHAGGTGVFWYEARLQPLADRDGAAVGSTLILRDITSRKQASARLEDELAFSEERFRSLFDQVAQLIGILDTDGNLLAVNRAAREMVGKTEEELIGRPFWDTPWWTTHKARTQVQEAVASAAAGEVVHFQTEHVDKAGRHHDIDFTLTPVRDADGRVVQLIPEGRDVTELHDQYRRAEVLAGQLEQARQLESLGRLAGGLAHDFEALVKVIRLNADEARRQIPPRSPVQTHLAEVAEAAGSIAQITAQLLAFSQGTTGVGSVAVGEALTASTRMLGRLLHDNIEVRHEPVPTLWPARADLAQLQHALINLALDAQEAMPDGGQLTIAARNVELDPVGAVQIEGARTGDFVCIEVSDTASEDSERGLTAVRGAVEAAAGFVDVRGRSVQLYFPRAGTP